MIKQLQAMIVALTAKGQQRQDQNLVRKALGMTAALVRKPADLAKNLDSLQRAYDLHAAETGSWIEPAVLASGGGGPFDACDLRHWLALAQNAGVPIVPATEILSLSEEEMELASGEVHIPDTAVSRGIRKRMAVLPEFQNVALEPRESEESRNQRKQALRERLFDAMNDVPDGHMVRSQRCGSDSLKALAGSGLAGPMSPEVRFGPDIEVGPGWVREGNRRRVDPSDGRTVALLAQGPGGGVFLSRPWMAADRYIATDDPHRHGTPFQGKGFWPCEWRAFAVDGVVTGVSVYYPWAGEVTPYNARMAIEVRRLAQKVVDQAKLQKAWPRLMDVEFMRKSDNPRVADSAEMQALLKLYGAEKVACSLDFLEVKGEGLMLLEGGPANTPFGGGHPCGFAGCGGPPRFGNRTITEGVAFRLMPNVLLGDPATWLEGDRTDRILAWEEVHALAVLPDVQSSALDGSVEPEISTIRF